MWKGSHSGRDVAVKVLRTPPNSGLQKIMSVGFRSCYLFTCQRADQVIEVLQGNFDVEIPPAPKCVATPGRDDDRDSV